jgi:hypothetical protein
MRTTSFRTVSASELDTVVPARVECFIDRGNAGVPMGFMQPLSHAQGRAETFYKRLGYREAGVIPGWTLGPAGERYTHVTLYRELAA